MHPTNKSQRAQPSPPPRVDAASKLDDSLFNLQNLFFRTKPPSSFDSNHFTVILSSTYFPRAERERGQYYAEMNDARLSLDHMANEKVQEELQLLKTDQSF